MLIELVRERFAQLVAENVPRRARRDGRDGRDGRAEAVEGLARPVARPGPPPGFTVRDGPQSGVASGPPDFEPSEDDEVTRSSPWRPSGQTGPTTAQAATQHRREGVPFGADGLPDVADGWDVVSPRRPAFRRTHVGVVAVLLVVGLLCAGWSVLRARPVAIASTPTVTAAPLPLPSGAGRGPSATRSAKPAVQILVHVLGAVRHPGVVRLPERARVQDAIDAAGGLRRDARPGDLNLAQVLSDGQQIVIGTAKEPTGQVRDGGADPSTGSTERDSGGASALDLNTATQTALEALPGVGPVTAEKILAWREEHHRFSRVEELQEVDGIGPKTYAEIAPHVRV